VVTVDGARNGPQNCCVLATVADAPKGPCSRLVEFGDVAIFLELLPAALLFHARSLGRGADISPFCSRYLLPDPGLWRRCVRRRSLRQSRRYGAARSGRSPGGRRSGIKLLGRLRSARLRRGDVESLIRNGISGGDATGLDGSAPAKSQADDSQCRSEEDLRHEHTAKRTKPNASPRIKQRL
jgi:hypothetical protein